MSSKMSPASMSLSGRSSSSTLAIHGTNSALSPRFAVLRWRSAKTTVLMAMFPYDGRRDHARPSRDHAFKYASIILTFIVQNILIFKHKLAVVRFIDFLPSMTILEG